MAGLSLFGIAATGARAVTSHLWYGDLRSALIVGTLAALCFAASLIFLMPGRLRRLIALRAGSFAQVFFAIVVLFVVLVATAVVERGAGEKVLGLVPRGFIVPISATLSILFFVAFVFPGIAYPASIKNKAPRPAGPAPKLVPVDNTLLSPWLRFALRALAIAHVALWGLAFWAWAFATVIPEPAIIEANRKYIVLTLLLSILPLGTFLALAPITNGSTRQDHLRVKLPVLLGLLLGNGLAAVVLPERVLPKVANAVLGASWETRPYAVVSSTAKSGLKGCRVKVVILLNPATGRKYDLCGVSKTIAERARPGATLNVLGKTSGYDWSSNGSW